MLAGVTGALASSAATPPLTPTPLLALGLVGGRPSEPEVAYFWRAKVAYFWRALKELGIAVRMSGALQRLVGPL